MKLLLLVSQVNKKKLREIKQCENYRPGTESKFQDFCITEILREINFKDF